MLKHYIGIGRCELTSTKCMEWDSGAQKLLEIMYYNRVKDIAWEFLMKQQFDCKFKSQLVTQKELEKMLLTFGYLALNFGSLNSHLALLELNGIHFCQFNYQIFTVFMDLLFNHFTGNRRFDLWV